jgi:hypothetical protein
VRRAGRAAWGNLTRKSGTRAASATQGVPAMAAAGGRRFETHHISIENELLICTKILDNRHDFSRKRLILSIKM